MFLNESGNRGRFAVPEECRGTPLAQIGHFLHTQRSFLPPVLTS
jgi:hypothetical protein